MRYFPIGALLPLFALGSASAPAEQAPDPVSIQPGQWEMVTEMTSVEAPGAPAELVEQMRASMASQRQVESQCITPEQARNPSGDILGGQNPAGCQYGETIWAGGIIRIRATCRPPNSPPVHMLVEGTYAAQQLDNRINVTMEMPNPAGAGAPIQLRLGGRMIGRRTGDCANPRIEPPDGNSAAPLP